MTERRSSLSIHTRVGNFARFSTRYAALGFASKFLGRASTIGAPVTVYLDYSSMQSGKISTERFAYRTTGVFTSTLGGMAIGAKLGGPWGAVGGR